jgi:hypothetical protein
VFLDYCSPDEELDSWEMSSEAERSSFCLGLGLKAEEQISFLKSFDKVKVDNFSGKVTIR